MHYRVLVGVSVLIALVFGSGTARASVPDELYVPLVSNQTTAIFTGGEVAGTLFHTNNDITFNSLGFIDLNANPFNGPGLNLPDGLLGSYQVAIWRIDSHTGGVLVPPYVPLTWTLMASTTVTPASPKGENFTSQFRYASIPPTTILAGEDFLVGALLPANPQDAWLIDYQTLNAPGIVGPGAGYFLQGNTLSFPTQAAGHFYAVANASNQIVPEPASLSLLALGGLALLRRQRHASDPLKADDVCCEAGSRKRNPGEVWRIGRVDR